MKAKILVYALPVLILATIHIAQAQQPGKILRIGYLAASGDPYTPEPRFEAFRQELRDLGNIEGKNVQIEYRYAEGKLDRVLSSVTEFVKLNVEVLVVGSHAAVLAAKQATKTIPIVMMTAQDPVATGIVDSLAHPGGNITGLTTLTRDLSGKRLELLKEVVPGVSRVGILWDSNAPGPSIAFKEYQAEAPAQKIQLQSLEVQGPNPDFEGAFQTAAKRRANAIITVTGRVFNRYHKWIADLAVKSRLPSMYEGSVWVEAGGLMSYSSNDAENYKRLAIYVDKILKGAKPADLPIEQPRKFDLCFNLKTAKQIGLTIPPNVLARADKVLK